MTSAQESHMSSYEQKEFFLSILRAFLLDSFPP